MSLVIDIDIAFSRTGKQLMFERTNIRLGYLRNHLSLPATYKMVSDEEWAHFDKVLMGKMERAFDRITGEFDPDVLILSSHNSVSEYGSEEEYEEEEKTGGLTSQEIAQFPHCLADPCSPNAQEACSICQMSQHTGGHRVKTLLCLH